MILFLPSLHKNLGLGFDGPSVRFCFHRQSVLLLVRVISVMVLSSEMAVSIVQLIISLVTMDMHWTAML